MSPEIVALLGIVLGGGGVGAIAAWRKAGSESHKNKADSESILVKTAMALIVPLKERISALELQNDECETRAAVLAQTLAQHEQRIAKIEGGGP